MNRNEEHINFLDYIRGVAILAVFLFHSVFVSFFWLFQRPNELVWSGLFRDFHAEKSLLAVLPATMGWIGVAIFFAVSGFCIHLSHERSKLKSWKVFTVRRFFRIYPPYLIAMLAFAAMLPFGHHGTDYLGMQIASHVGLFYNLTPPFINYDPIFSLGISASFWSIAVEVQLYLIYPLLLWLVKRLGWNRTLWITAAVDLGVRAVQGSLSLLPVSTLQAYPGVASFLDWWCSMNPFGFWFTWSIGAALADAYLKGEPLRFRNTSIWLWPALFLVCFCVKPLSPFMFPLGAISTVYIIAYLLERRPVLVPEKGIIGFAFYHLRWVGIVSYSAYLIHGPILSQIPRVVDKVLNHQHLHPLVVLAACMLAWPFIFGLSYLFFRFIETPSINWGKKVIKNLRETPANTVSAPVVPEKS